LFFSLHSGQILSPRVVSKGASVLVKENKPFSFSLELYVTSYTGIGVAKIKTLKT